MNRTLITIGLAAVLAGALEAAAGTDSRPAGGASQPAPKNGPSTLESLTEESRAAANPPAADSATGQSPAAVDDSSLVFRFEIGSRLYPDWKEEQTVRLSETIHLGDSEYWAKARAFLPDFKLGDKGPFSESRSWKNPAVQVMVYDDSTAVDSTWAFRDFPPHFSARSFFTFKLLEIVVPGPVTGAR